MPVNDSVQHVVRTSTQWDERAIEFWVVPRGCLCVELTPDGKTKIKIGEGNKFYSQLPYITSEGDLSNYYTKTEIDNLLTNLNRMAIQSTEEYDSKNDLPLTGNKLGDVRFVKSASPSIKTDPDVYVWDNTKWIYVGYDFSQIDLSEYVKKEEFEPVKEKVDEMYPLRHTHTNKEILDQIEVAFKVVDKNKLDLLENYDDTEVKNRLTNVENKAHVHNNMQILNATTAAFTIPDKNKLDSLRNYDVFRGTNGIIPGSVGLVPAPQPVDVGKVLGADGRWVDVDVAPFTGATATTDGEEGLVPAPLAGEQSYYLRGDGTWAKVKSGDKYRAGDGIYILAGDVLSTTLPVEIYAKDNKLKQYVLYGGENPVGDWDSTLSKYAVVIKVSAESMSDISTSLFLDDPIGNGDYIDYENQRFVHTRTNMTFDVRSGEWRRWIHADGTTTGDYTYQDRMAPSDYIAVSSEYVYLYYPGDMHGCDQFGIPCYAALYDENKIFTRSILLRSFTEVTIEPQPGEVYMRVSFGYYQGATYKLTKIGEVITPIVLPPVIIYTNKVNTIDVMTANKPTEVYFETAVVEDTSEDPMSEYTGIIYNDGVLDITQEDPNALNELTVHFRESDKVITIPAGGSTYTAGDGIDIDANDEISAKLGSGLQFDANGAIEVTGGGGGGDSYAEGQGIEFTPDPRSVVLPSTYQQIEYLQGTGTQGIILNYTPMSTTPADIKYELTYSELVSEPTGWHYLIGGWLQSSHKMPPSIVYSNDNYQDKLVLSICEADIITNGDWPTGNTAHTSIVTIDGSTAKMQLDSGTESSGTWSGSIDHAPAIFASNRGSGTLGSFSAYKFRELKIYENDILIHHYYPCYRKSDNEPGIYDVITNTFLTNDGTGDFICGNNVNYDDTFINTKLGDGLSFDSNDAITVDEMTGATALANGASGTVPAPLAGDDAKFLRGDGSWAEVDAATNYVEGNAIEFGHPGMTDLGFDFDTFVSKFTPPNNGIVSVDSTNKAFTLTATGFDCYTNPWVSGSLYTIPVVGGRKYRLTWNSNASNVDGTIYAFENADTSHMHGVNQADQNYLEFTADTSSNVNFRFGVTNSGNSVTFSNIKFYEVDNGDPDTNIINVKYGNGLSLDNSNRLQANTMTGADGTNAGTAGIVPAPTATDNTKFLKGDGTWSDTPTYTLPTASTSTLGGIKVGNNLTIDANGVLSAIGGSGGGSYTAGDGIDIEPTLLSKGFSYTDFINSVSGNGRGTLTKNNDNSFTMTATDDDFFTNPFNLDQGISGVYIFSPVEGEKTYRLTWDSSDRTVSGRVFVFENGRSQPLHYVDQSTDEYLEFTTASGTTSLSFRFGVENTGDTLTYSNIELYEVVSESSIISAKLGNGLDFDSNDAIEVQPATTTTLGGVKVGAGLSMNANDELGVDSPYVTSVANQGSTPGVITVAKSDGISSDVDVLENLRLILNCNCDSSQNQT